MLTLTREGLKCGIVFVVTASNYSDLRYRLSQNFKQKIGLQLNDPDDYINIFGRGLVKMEYICEFQTARICEVEKWNSYIKEVNNYLK